MTRDWDVLVVGAGGGGLSAAIAAAERGARVVVFESEGEVGGSTRLSAGVFTAAGTSVQAALGVEDSTARYFQHYMDLNQWRLRPGLIRSFCERSTDVFEWLLGLGLEVPAQLSTNAHTPGLTRAGVEDVWRGHVPAGEGYGLVEVLERARRERGCDLVLHSRVQELLVDPSSDGLPARVRGVRVDDVEVEAAAVVIASGGLTQDRALAISLLPGSAGRRRQPLRGVGPGQPRRPRRLRRPGRRPDRQPRLGNAARDGVLPTAPPLAGGVPA